MTSLYDAMKQSTQSPVPPTTHYTRTENNAITYKNSGDACLDLFSHIGAMLKVPSDKILDAFKLAYVEDEIIAKKIWLWSRDIRAGSGLRHPFISIAPWLLQKGDSLIWALIFNDIGYWKDAVKLFESEDTSIMAKTEIITTIANFIETNDEGQSNSEGSLIWKWLPRKGKLFNALRNHLSLTPKQLRKWIVSQTQVVEQFMCANKWDKIDYSHVPSKAINKYSAAFHRHDEAGYLKWREGLKSGVDVDGKKVKVSAGAIYPHEISYNSYWKDDTLADAQWNALPNYINTDENILCMVDTSGSMEDVNGPHMALNVAVSLGIYCAERNEGVFKNKFITFSNQPELQAIHEGDTLKEKIQRLKSASWTMNTDINKAYKLILDSAKLYSVPQEEMPSMLLVLSDMQFDQGCSGGYDYSYHNKNSDKPDFDKINKWFEQAGYKMPKMVYWNLRSSTGSPAQSTHSNVGLISGFSPSIMKAVLSAEDFTPKGIMLKTIDKPIYDTILGLE